MDKIAVLIPCYNESKTIEKVIKDFKEVLPDATIYVYDNNSTDGTDEIARRNGAIVRYEYQQGKGNVIRRMFRDIDAECYIMTDGDDTYPAVNAPEMVDKVLNRNVDMGVGNSLVRSSINHLFHTDIKDIMTGYRAFSYEFVKTFPVISRGFEIETEMSIHAADKNMFVENVVVDYKDRPEGSESKLNTYSDGFKVLRTIARLFRTYQPMKYFGSIAGVLAVLGGGFSIPVFKDYFATGLVKRFPTLIVCCFVILTAIVSLFSGAILKTITWKNRQDFEMTRHQARNKKEELLKEAKEAE